MNNELDGRLRRLEAGQANLSEQLTRLTDEVGHIHRELGELVRLMKEPDENTTKLYEMLTKLVGTIAANTALQQRLEGDPAGRANRGRAERH